MVRTLGAEKMLTRELKGYTAYQKKVRYRLIPGFGNSPSQMGRFARPWFLQNLQKLTPSRVDLRHWALGGRECPAAGHFDELFFCYGS
jgi:hypothetical protein